MKLKTLLPVMLLLAVAGGFAFVSLGGMTWVDEMGLRGQPRALEARVAGYWDARIAADLNAMADYIHPQQTRMYDPGLLEMISYDIAGVEITGEQAVATVNVKVRVKLPSLSDFERDKSMQDRWVRYEGTWYRELREDL